LVGPGFDYVATQWGIFRAGGVAVPLCVSHPVPELVHVIDDSEPVALIADGEFEARLAPLASTRKLPLVTPASLLQSQARALPEIDPGRPAMLIYTSGTTGRPKGAISTHAILAAQLQSIVTAWQMAPSDRLLHVLPLHHLHGVLNALGAPLYAGASVEMLPRFDAAQVIEHFMSTSGSPAPPKRCQRTSARRCATASHGCG
jgi:malonyl-CoA/methylmalonyl-CoA synthetase